MEHACIILALLCAVILIIFYQEKLRAELIGRIQTAHAASAHQTARYATQAQAQDRVQTECAFQAPAEVPALHAIMEEAI